MKWVVARFRHVGKTSERGFETGKIRLVRLLRSVVGRVAAMAWTLITTLPCVSSIRFPLGGCDASGLGRRYVHPKDLGLSWLTRKPHIAVGQPDIPEGLIRRSTPGVRVDRIAQPLPNRVPAPLTGGSGAGTSSCRLTKFLSSLALLAFDTSETQGD